MKNTIFLLLLLLVGCKTTEKPAVYKTTFSTIDPHFYYEAKVPVENFIGHDSAITNGSRTVVLSSQGVLVSIDGDDLTLTGATTSALRESVYPVENTLDSMVYPIHYFPNSQTTRCIPYEMYTEWEGQPSPNNKPCVGEHSWVYAEYQDVNEVRNFTFAVAQWCDCSCTKMEREARICTNCLRHETRTHETGEHATKELSDYSKLRNKLK